MGRRAAGPQRIDGWGGGLCGHKDACDAQGSTKETWEEADPQHQGALFPTLACRHPTPTPPGNYNSQQGLSNKGSF